MTTQDVRDMLDLPRDTGPGPPKLRKHKPVEKRPDGINRELYALLGERAAPVVITEHAHQYKKRPKRNFKVARWRVVPFNNQARTDDLVLRHWKRQAGAPAADGTDVAEEVPEKTQDSVIEGDYHFAKYNIKVEYPEYDEAQYMAHLRSDDWSKEETDYLVDLVREYYHRWPLVADRYAFDRQNGDIQLSSAGAVASVTKPRTMEDMKARYYSVSAKLMALHTPVTTMSTSEFDFYERLSKFDPQQETNRKRLADSLMKRTPEEIEEEEFLLGELQRITMDQDRLASECKEVRDRHEYPQSSGGNSHLYQSSQALTQLWQQMQSVYKNDKTKKRPSIAGPASADATSRAVVQGALEQGEAGHSQHKRLSAPSTVDEPPRTRDRHRNVPRKENLRFGVSSHDRLISGATFRNDRVESIRQGKVSIPLPASSLAGTNKSGSLNQSQRQRLGELLKELRVPEVLSLPTEKVCDDLEALVAGILRLEGLRGVTARLENEVKVLEAEEELLSGQNEAGEEAESKGAGQNEDGVIKAEEGTSGADAEQTQESQGTVQKRSASVLSAASSSSETKRPRK